MVEDTGRAAKYRETFKEELALSQKEVAALCILMLRGAQTPGEIKGRSGRIYNFQSLEETEEVLQALTDRAEGALASKLERQTGMKERLFSLEGELERLKLEIEELKSAFARFKKQFE
jgi:uncharacterized protein YceH (UPF0502 family)